MFSEKWKPIIIYYLIHEGTLRYHELQQFIPDINKRMLTLRLKELEADGVIHRKAYAEVPPRVEYSITDYGRTVAPVLKLMNAWGEEHAKSSGAVFPPEDNPGHVCHALTTLETIDGKWKLLIILQLLQGRFRFQQLLEEIPTSRRTLSIHLKALQEAGIVDKFIYNEVPPRVEYAMTDYGYTLQPLLERMSAWGKGSF